MLEFSGDGGGTKVGSHGEVGNGGSGKDDDGDLVEQSLTTGDGEVPSDDDEVNEEHYREDCPKLLDQQNTQIARIEIRNEGDSHSRNHGR